MPAGRKARWPARSAWRWPARAAMAARIVNDPFLNAEAPQGATPDDIGRALDLLRRGVRAAKRPAYAALALVV